MKEFILPEKWAVKITEENQNILKDYVESFSDFDDAYELSCHGFVISDRYDGSYQFWCDTLEDEKYTEITFDQFKQYVLKQKPEKMKKEHFTIEGIEPLKKAFVEASGFGDNGIDADYLTSSNLKEKCFTARNSKLNTHFILPQQWDEAMEYVKNFWEPEFKVGDLVFIECGGFGSSGLDNCICKIVENQKVNNGVGGSSLCVERKGIIWGVNNNHKKRHATPEEIEQYNLKLPTINTYEGKIEGDFIIYGNNCAVLPIIWFKEHKGATITIKELTLSSGVKINEEQMNQIRKIVNAKTK